MHGAGVRYKKNQYVTHTTLSNNKSALETFTLWQKTAGVFLCGVVIFGLFYKTLLTAQIIIGVLSFIYFVDVLFNLFIIAKSLLHAEEVSSSKEELERLNEKTFPIYSILCPLYKEAHIVPH